MAEIWDKEGIITADVDPKKALEMTADFYLRCENYTPACVLENKINGVLYQNLK